MRMFLKEIQFPLNLPEFFYTFLPHDENCRYITQNINSSFTSKKHLVTLKWYEFGNVLWIEFGSNPRFYKEIIGKVSP